ncbi:hypothetical protein [Dyella ginsengisoli]|uniref:hypothetical protein n=1 Tax=Dyella ginsengisoli TaxID=363848 RepID=UPI0012FDBDAB|nr:hypothetical protein [Dyella ginsengisoli]
MSLLFVAGCGTMPKPPQFDDSISQLWTESMARYHLHAVFPASSDVHVGDVYYFLNCDTTQNKGKPDLCADIEARPAAMSIKAGYQDPNAYLNAYYSKVPMVVFDTKDTSGHTLEAPRFDRVVDFNRLPSVILPAFSGTASGSVAVGASLPARFLSLVFGGSSEKNLAYTVSFQDVRTYGLPVQSSLDLLSQFCGPIPPRCDVSYVQMSLRSRLTTSGNAPPFIGIIDRVYVARSITFTFGRNVASAVDQNLVVNLQHALANQEAAQAARGADGSAQHEPLVVSAATAPASASSVKGAADAMSGLASARLNGALNTVAPGESVAVKFANGESVALEETFAEPVVIGYGVTFAPLGGASPAM